MDLQERHQLDLMAARMQQVRKKARPWHLMISTTLAIAALVAAEFWGVSGRTEFFAHDHTTQTIITLAGGVAFLVFGMSALIGLAGKTRDALQPVVGTAHAAIVRYVLMLFGVFVILFVGLTVLGRQSASQLLIGTAVTGVLLGIAAQQSLANLFAGLVLLFARPFRVGDRARFRSGALSGQIEGTVVDVSLTYVRLETDDGPVMVPNAQALAAAVQLVKPQPPDGTAPGSGAGQSAGVPGAAADSHPDARSQARPSSATSASDWPHTSR